MGPEMEKVVANVLNLVDAAKEDVDRVALEVAVVVVLMMRIPGYC